MGTALFSGGFTSQTVATGDVEAYPYSLLLVGNSRAPLCVFLLPVDTQM